MKLFTTSSTLLHIVSIIAGILLCIPAMTEAREVIIGKVISTQRHKNLLTLMPDSQGTKTVTVSYNDQTFLCGRGSGCCMHPGNMVEIEGAFSDSDATVFTAFSIKGSHIKKHHDPTGVRARLHTCSKKTDE